jgi:hypothetical protein
VESRLCVSVGAGTPAREPASPKVCSTKASIDGNEATVESVKPAFANGLTITIGTRVPSPDGGGR